MEVAPVKQGMARRLSDALFSPFRVMERIGEQVADYIIPDAPAAAAASASTEAAAPPPPPPPPAAPAPAAAASTKTTGKRAPAAAKKQPAVKKSKPASPKAAASKSSPKIKQEVMRDLPFRASRSTVKAGFYSENNLASLAWRGTGTMKDPITIS